MRIGLHYDVEGWAYHRRCQALAKYAPHGVSVHLSRGNRPDRRERCDLALQLCYSQVSELRNSYRRKKIDPIIVAGLNIGWNDQARRWLPSVLRDADHVIINSRECYDGAGRPRGASWISNGVDRDVFHVQTPIAARPPRVLWTGSLFHRQTKGYDELLVPLTRRLWKDGIECDFRLVDSHGGPSRWPAEQMAAWYNTGTVVVCASRSEGTPNPCIEAAACGCVIVSTPVGNMPELVEHGFNGFLVERTVDALYRGVIDAIENYPVMAAAMQERIDEWGWNRRAAAYFELFERIIAKRESQSC